VNRPGWVVVVPVKPLATAKTRLHTGSLALPHTALVLAMACDTVAAVSACRLVTEVLVVTDDPQARRVLDGLGARVVPDAPAGGLNLAIAYGASVAAGSVGAVGSVAVGSVAVGSVAVAAVTADLPALRTWELTAALQAAAGGPVTGPPAPEATRAMVPDAAGSGTTLLAAPPGVPLEPRFGADSALAHQRTGARRLDGDWPSLRRDVDTLPDLVEAQRLGLGRHTAALLGGTLTAGKAGGRTGQRA
jgi:2-phospho-L-lactate/phosphoenolpyruvate guanylyltransferase